MIKHTQGPWGLGKRKNHGGNYEIAKQGQPIACVYTEEWGYDAKDGWANAKLIAAAPQMLEALELARNVLAAIITGDLNTITLDSNCLFKVRAAIAKAKGE